MLRLGYAQKIVMATVITEELTAGFQTDEAGLRVYAAIQGIDFARTVQTVVFSPGMVQQYSVDCRREFCFRVSFLDLELSFLLDSFTSQKLTIAGWKITCPDEKYDLFISQLFIL
jgi:hypothetical protein